MSIVGRWYVHPRTLEHMAAGSPSCVCVEVAELFDIESTYFPT